MDSKTRRYWPDVNRERIDDVFRIRNYPGFIVCPRLRGTPPLWKVYRSRGNFLVELIMRDIGFAFGKQLIQDSIINSILIRIDWQKKKGKYIFAHLRRINRSLDELKRDADISFFESMLGKKRNERGGVHFTCIENTASMCSLYRQVSALSSVTRG